MKHLKNFKVLNRTHAHRKALYRNMMEALFKNERIQTTKVKAMEIRRVAEKIITRAKEKNLHNIRIVSKVIKDKQILMKLFNEIAPRYLERKGGYTRVFKLAKRKGDGAEMAYLTLIEDEVEKKKKKKKKVAEKKTDTAQVKEASEKIEQKPVEEAVAEKTATSEEKAE